MMGTSQSSTILVLLLAVLTVQAGPPRPGRQPSVSSSGSSDSLSSTNTYSSRPRPLKAPQFLPHPPIDPFDFQRGRGFTLLVGPENYWINAGRLGCYNFADAHDFYDDTGKLGPDAHVKAIHSQQVFDGYVADVHERSDCLITSSEKRLHKYMRFWGTSGGTQKEDGIPEQQHYRSVLLHKVDHAEAEKGNAFRDGRPSVMQSLRRSSPEVSLSMMSDPGMASRSEGRGKKLLRN